MELQLIDEILKIRPKLKGDQLRIILYLLKHVSASVSELKNGTGISESHVSENCSFLYEKGIFKRYEYNIGKLRYVNYSINPNFKINDI